MKRNLQVFGIIMLVILLATSIVVAQTKYGRSEDVTEDTHSDVNSPGTDVNGARTDLEVEGSEAACNVVSTGFFKWDLSDIPQNTETVQSTTLTFPVTFANTAGSASLTLYKATDSWDESSTNSALQAISPGDALGTIVGASTGGNIVFTGSGATNELVKYVQAEIDGDRSASFMLRFTSDCPGGGTAYAVINSKEAGTPTLAIENTNVVTLTSFHAAGAEAAPNWPLYAGITGVAILALGALGLARRFGRES